MPMAANVTPEPRRDPTDTAPCAGKRKYRSRKAARDGVRWMARANSTSLFHDDGKRRDQGRIEPYFCSRHDCWHVGHRPAAAACPTHRLD